MAPVLTKEKPSPKKSPTKNARITTPYYLIDEKKLLENMKKMAFVRERSGAKVVLALKCFSTWSVFDIMKPYMDGTTSSSLYEARLGHEKFGKETHAYSVAFSEDDVKAAVKFATKIIFNSASQLKRFLPLTGKLPLGIRINPGISHSHFDLADPARKHTRLGISNKKELEAVLPHVTGAMFHCNCENSEIKDFFRIIDHIEKEYAPVLEKLEWVSLGGGIYFTKEGYPLEAFADRLAAFAKKFNVQVYLEPGESSITQAGTLVTTVLDTMHNGIDIAVVDSAVETHMLDLMIYETPAKVVEATAEGTPTMITGRTCLAGDVFGTYKFAKPLKVGDTVTFADAAGYTMVKKNWFNGIQMPSIVIRRANGKLEVAKQFTYSDYLSSLS